MGGCKEGWVRGGLIPPCARACACAGYNSTARLWHTLCCLPWGAASAVGPVVSCSPGLRQFENSDIQCSKV